MAELKTPKDVMAELLALSPSERESRTPVDGVEQVVLAYIHKAISEQDGGMLKYIIDFADKATAKVADDEETPAQKIAAWKTSAEAAIDG